MTVKQLIARLSELPSDAIVCFDGDMNDDWVETDVKIVSGWYSDENEGYGYFFSDRCVEDMEFDQEDDFDERHKRAFAIVSPFNDEVD